MDIDFLQLSSLQMVLAVGIIFLAYVIKGFSGFGSGLIAMPLLAFFVPITLIVPTLGLLSYGGTIVLSLSLKHEVKWSELFWVLPFTVIGIVSALWLLTHVDANQLVLALGVFVVFYASYSLMSPVIAASGKQWGVMAGYLGGMVGALFGTGGPFYVIYLKMRQLNKAQLRATIAMVFLFDGGTRMAGYAYSGFYTERILWLVFMLLPVLLMGMFVGDKLHRRVGQKNFNKLINSLLLLSGMMLIVKSVSV